MVSRAMVPWSGAGPSVETVLTNPSTRPGHELLGQVVVVGTSDVTIEQIVLGLVAELDAGPRERGAGRGGRPVEFYQRSVAGRFGLAAGQRRAIDFSVPVPWQTPLTHVYRQPLTRVTIGARPKLAIDATVSSGDLVPVYVHPLPAQQRILDAFVQLGFRHRHSVLEGGRIPRVNQQLPFYQEIGWWPPPDYAGQVTELELIFLPDPDGMDMVLGLDRWAGAVAGERPSVARLRVSHSTVDQMDWRGVVDGWVREAARRHAAGHRAAPETYPDPPATHPAFRPHGATPGQGMYGTAGGEPDGGAGTGSTTGDGNG